MFEYLHLPLALELRRQLAGRDLGVALWRILHQLVQILNFKLEYIMGYDGNTLLLSKIHP